VLAPAVRRDRHSTSTGRRASRRLGAVVPGRGAERLLLLGGSGGPAAVRAERCAPGPSGCGVTSGCGSRRGVHAGPRLPWVSVHTSVAARRGGTHSSPSAVHAGARRR